MALSHRALMRVVMAVFFAAGGVLHFRATDALVAMTPTFVPFPREIVRATGVLEILGALLLLVPRLRRPLGIAFALYVIAVWPANFKHALEGLDLPPVPNSWWYHGPRLALQPLIAWWCLYATRVIDWSWRK